MRCHHFLFALLIGLLLCMRSTKSDRVTTYREFKVVETPGSSNPDADPDAHHTDNSNKDVSFYVDADEHLEKLQTQAEELRDTYNELIKNAFGRELKRNRTTIATTTTPAPVTKTTTIDDSAEVVGGTRKASADWVRAAINPMFLNDRPSMLDTNKATDAEKKITTQSE